MQIGGASPPVSSVPSLQAVRTPAPDVSPDLLRASQSPATPGQAVGDEQDTASREEADQPGTRPEAARRDTDATPSEQRIEQLQVAELVSRDQEVRTHEQAHAAVGGAYAGAPTYTYTRGPDGKRYVTGGEVSIDVAPVPNDPQATLRKMEIVLRAALAPAEPSAQDLRVAAEAQAQITQARAELAALRSSEAAPEDDPKTEAQDGDAPPEATSQEAASPAPGLDLYRRIGEDPQPAAQVDLVA